jgi:DNA-binding NtrC family response regulator
MPHSTEIKILLVEDNPDLVAVFKSFLADSDMPEDFFTRDVPCLSEVPELTCSHDFDVIVIDLNLTNSDRDSILISHLKTLSDIDLPFIVISGCGDTPSIHAALIQGASAFFVRGEATAPQIVRSIVANVYKDRSRKLFKDDRIDEGRANRQLEKLNARLGKLVEQQRLCQG